MEKIITYCGQTAKVGCDEKCEKAWGSNNRPRIYPQISDDKIFGLNGESVHPPELYVEGGNIPDDFDLDEYAYCSDSELGDAPEDPGTYEDDDAKPINKEGIPNKWCVRECERCTMSDVGKYNQPLEFPDFSKRYYNAYPHTRG